MEHIFSIIRQLGLRVSTVYIGGGTPTTLDAEQLEILLSQITRLCDVSSLEEFTLEAGRPDTITAEKLAVAAAHGVTRVSVNTQTLNEQILRAIGRSHTAADFMKAYAIAEKSGIRDINVDLIAGLPGESFESFQSSLDQVIALSPSNITVHTFYVKRAASILQSGVEVYRGEDRNAAASVSYAQSALAETGYLPYYLYRQKNTVGNLENVGFCKPGCEGLYNIFMMEEVHTVFGAGASAMTKLVAPDTEKIKIDRICELKYPYEYLNDHEGARGIAARQTLADAAAAFYGRYF